MTNPDVAKSLYMDIGFECLGNRKGYKANVYKLTKAKSGHLYWKLTESHRIVLTRDLDKFCIERNLIGLGVVHNEKFDPGKFLGWQKEMMRYHGITLVPAPDIEIELIKHKLING